MSLGPLDKISRSFKSTQDGLVISREVNLFQSTIQKEAATFLSDLDKAAKRAKQNRVILIGIIPKETGSG
jgi:hypothetical protein